MSTGNKCQRKRESLGLGLHVKCCPCLLRLLCSNTGSPAGGAVFGMLKTLRRWRPATLRWVRALKVYLVLVKFLSVLSKCKQATLGASVAKGSSQLLCLPCHHSSLSVFLSGVWLHWGEKKQTHLGTLWRQWASASVLDSLSANVPSSSSPSSSSIFKFHYIVQGGRHLLILRLPTPECWDYRTA